jgi:hypothetical protein
MNGWWKCHRKMTDHAVWNLSDAQFKVWVTILMYANHRDQDWWDGSLRLTIPAGSFITSQDHLATLSRTSRKTVRLSIDALIRIGSITANTRAKKYTEITLINSDKYRGTDIEEGQQEGQVGAKQGPSEGQVGATTGEGRELEKEKKRTLLVGFDAFWMSYPKKLGKETAKKAWAKISPQNGLSEAILASVDQHKKTPDWLKDGGQFIPYPATFLNGKLWEDVLTVTKQPEAVPDHKKMWGTQDYYLRELKAGRVSPRYRVPEWEPTPFSAASVTTTLPLPGTVTTAGPGQLT